MLILALSLFGCSDHGFASSNDAGADPGIELEPRTVDFGELSQGEVGYETFLIHSVGGTDLNVEKLELGNHNGNFAIETEISNLFLPPGASEEVEVSYWATSESTESVDAIVHSNDPDIARDIVDLRGRGKVPELLIEPDPLDFGNLYVGCDEVQEITITNVGSDTVDIYDVYGDGADMTYTFLESLPLTLEPEESTVVELLFAPSDAASYSGELTVISSEPLGERVATQEGAGRFVGETTDSWSVEDPPSDIMFIVDQSCSMDDDQTRLNNNFSYFIQNLEDYTTNWNIIVANSDNGCNNSGILNDGVSDYEGRFTSAVKSGGGTYLESQEALLIPAANGINNTDSGECNSGFLRGGALLHVILVSDEHEQSGNWQGYTDQIINKKGDPDKVRVSAIAGDIPNGCNGNQAGYGYYEATQYTDGLFLSICASDWSGYMSDLAQASVSQTAFELSETPVESSMEVTINGSPANGWTYDPSSNTITFDEGAAPGDGDTLEVSYGELATCN